MKLITLTGIDDGCLVPFIEQCNEKYRSFYGSHGLVEFAILRSPKVGQSHRYPTVETIRAITNYVYPDSLAFHLCGEYARMALDPSRWLELVNIIDFNLVSRVQINAVNTSDPALLLTAMRFRHYIGKPVILQWREPTFQYAPTLSFLQDNSGGRGVLESTWASPSKLIGKEPIAFGYAGGLNPENIREEYPKMREAAKGRMFWVDCESGIRTDDRFDTAKAEAMIEGVLSNFKRDGKKVII